MPAQDWIPRRAGQEGLEKVLFIAFEYRREEMFSGKTIASTARMSLSM
jgi:hypothetical protein